MTGSTSLIVRGIIGVLVGIAAFAWPGVTITALVLLFGVYALLDGISNIAGGFTGATVHGRSWPLVVEGIVGILAGILTFMWPGITIVALVMLIGAWAVVTGVIEIAAAIRLRREISGEWLLAASGALSILFGLLLLASPLVGAVVVAWWFGAFALLDGIVLIALGARLRQHRVKLAV